MVNQISKSLHMYSYELRANRLTPCKPFMHFTFCFYQQFFFLGCSPSQDSPRFNQIEICCILAVTAFCIFNIFQSLLFAITSQPHFTELFSLHQSLSNHSFTTRDRRDQRYKRDSFPMCPQKRDRKIKHGRRQGQILHESLKAAISGHEFYTCSCANYFRKRSIQEQISVVSYAQ